MEGKVGCHRDVERLDWSETGGVPLLAKDARNGAPGKEHMEFLVTVPLLILDDLGMRKLPLTAAEELLEIIMRRHERASTMLTSNRPVEDWGKLLGDATAVSAMLDRLLHHGHVLKCGPPKLENQNGRTGTLKRLLVLHRGAELLTPTNVRASVILSCKA